MFSVQTEKIINFALFFVISFLNIVLLMFIAIVDNDFFGYAYLPFGIFSALILLVLNENGIDFWDY